MKDIVIYILTAVVIMFATNTHAAYAGGSGPFGTYMGMPITEFNIGNGCIDPIEFSKGNFIVYPPSKHEMFNLYFATVSPNNGLGCIKALKVDIYTDAYGETVKSIYNNLVSKIEKKYGEPTARLDYLKEGSIWTDPIYYTMGLFKKEREVSTIWVPAIDKNMVGGGLPNSIRSIEIGIKAKTINDCVVYITYCFDNYDNVIEEINTTADENL